MKHLLTINIADILPREACPINNFFAYYNHNINNISGVNLFLHNKDLNKGEQDVYRIYNYYMIKQKYFTVLESYKFSLHDFNGKLVTNLFTNTKWYTDLVAYKHFDDILNKPVNDNNWTPFSCFKGVDCSFNPVTNDAVYVNYVEHDKLNTYPSQVGIFIYAYSRSLMWNNILSITKVYGTDTDSAFIPIEDIKKVVEKTGGKVVFPSFIKGEKELGLEYLRPKINKEKEFGDFEVENYFNYMIYTSAKMYLMAIKNKNKIVI